VPCFAAFPFWQRGHEHAIIIDELDCPVRQHDVSVLDVAVCNTLALKIRCERSKIGTRLLQGGLVIKTLVQPNAERITFHPVHLYNGKGALPNLDPASLEIEVHKISVTQGLQFLRNLAVFLLYRRSFLLEASNRVLLARSTERICKGEAPREH